ncbi:MAG: nicotinate-nucleotide--dimethylbenzimidazole phosphoribosyltransferase [Actinobacteria bacterium]|nr:nicotinate-nucleotide--dimethylbenzimidazole phosphoribosyltransferase [Actinomycetota bacterium]MCA1721758.1 nicotinate-nucleotide--dimethylbenzimidazole phosphoribosyltransferase [Actinomycetota bacterium]
MSVERPVRVEGAAPQLGRLGAALEWLAAAQGSWPPRAPRHPRALDVACGDGLAAGRAEADALADAGADLLMLSSSADPVPGLVSVCALLDLEPVMAVGTAADAGWAARLVAVRDGLRAARQHVGDPERLAADPVLGRLVGLLGQSALRKTPVVLDVSAAVAGAALVAERLEPGARHWWLAGSQPPGTAARLALADLALEPLLDLGLAVPGGGRMAASLLTQAVELLAAPPP